MSEGSKVAKALGYQFSDVGLLKLALTHPSMGPDNNQRLEYLGDAVLQLSISDLIYRLHAKMPEGEMTRLRASLVCEETLFDIAKALQLERSIVSKPRLSRMLTGYRSIMADAVEALLAAVYLDGGFEAVKAIVARLWTERVKAGELPQSSKNKLQEYFAARSLPEPVYETIGEEGPPHKRLFTARVTQGGTELAQGEGRSKKAAEQAAAETAMQAILNEEASHEA